jgi:hypothetical protein
MIDRVDQSTVEHAPLPATHDRSSLHGQADRPLTGDTDQRASTAGASRDFC